jgi:hypothetical protein
MWQCSQQHENREEAKFCAKCGERRVERVICAACGTVLEPTDIFCISCGYKVEVKRAPFAAPVVIAPPPPPPPPPVAEPVAVPVAAIATPAPPPVVAVTEPATPAPTPDASQPEEFSFSFGGTTIGTKTPVKQVKKSKSPMTTGIMSFVVLGVLLLIAIYLLSR